MPTQSPLAPVLQVSLRTNRGLFLALALLASGTPTTTVNAAAPPAPIPSADVNRALDQARQHRDAQAPKNLTIVLLADRKDHGPGAHDYPRWQSRWALLLGGSSASSEKAANLAGPDRPHPMLAHGAKNIRVEQARGWPEPSQWSDADLVVAFCYIAWTETRLEQVRRFLERNGGLVLIHSATWTKPQPSADVANVAGVGGFQKYRHGRLAMTITAPSHPICLGMPPTFCLEDESYWPPTPAIPLDPTNVLAGSEEKPNAEGDSPALQPMFWTHRKGRGRTFGCVPGHFSETFDHPYFRMLLLRGMAWAAGGDPYRFDDLVLRSASVAPDRQ